MEDRSDPIDKVLRPEERVLWRGQPDANVLFSPQDIFLVPFSIMWAGMALFPVGATFSGAFSAQPHPLHPGPFGSSLFLMVWCIPFLCAGFYMTLGRFLHLRWLKRRTWYTLTDKRIIIVTQGVLNQAIREQGVTAIKTIERNMRKGDIGTIQFDPPGTLDRLYRIWPIQRLGAMAFLDIHGANSVYELLSDARKTAEK